MASAVEELRPMKLSDLSPVVRERLNAMRYDRIIEKHEGPWSWE